MNKSTFLVLLFSFSINFFCCYHIVRSIFRILHFATKQIILSTLDSDNFKIVLSDFFSQFFWVNEQIPIMGLQWHNSRYILCPDYYLQIRFPVLANRRHEQVTVLFNFGAYRFNEQIFLLNVLNHFHRCYNIEMAFVIYLFWSC